MWLQSKDILRVSPSCGKKIAQPLRRCSSQLETELAAWEKFEKVLGLEFV